MAYPGIRLAMVSLASLLSGCFGVPKGVSVVNGFELESYLGTWHEIARLDHPFERGLSNVSAQYSLRKDGGVSVLNRGFDAKKGKWKEAKGKAYFVAEPSVGRLKVSFFGPFYGAYNIIELDKDDYSYALVCGPNRSYLWILARGKTLSNDVKERLVKKAKDLGFDTASLIWVSHQDA